MHASILATHIGMGTLGVLSGVAAIALRKGSPQHRAAGTVFVLAMISMAATACVLELMKPVPGSPVGGLMTIYFITTAWIAGRRKDGEFGSFEIVAALAALALATSFAVSAYNLATGIAKAPNPIFPYVLYLISFAMAVAAAADFSVVYRRGISGTERIARHLWRMCFGLFISVGSFAAQGSRVLPREIRTEVLIASLVLVLVVLFYWLIRVRLTNWYSRVE